MNLKVTTSKLLISNIKSLMIIKGMNNDQISKKATNGGYPIHPTTFKNVLEGSSCGINKLEAIAFAFDIEPAFLLWPSGYNEDGQPVGVGSSVSLSAVSWSVKKVTLALSHAEVDDLDFQSNAISKLIKIASEEGIEAADLEWSKLLTDYHRS